MNSSRHERIFDLIGLGLLMLCFLLSLGCIFGRYSHPDEAAGKTSIRFAYWQLESGLRDAFDWLDAEYMRLHPNGHFEPPPAPPSPPPTAATPPGNLLPAAPTTPAP